MLKLDQNQEYPYLIHFIQFPPEKRLKGTPGPQYDPAIKPEAIAPPHFSFGYRRDLPGSSALAPTCSTPVIVGPGAYL